MHCELVAQGAPILAIVHAPGRKFRQTFPVAHVEVVALVQAHLLPAPGAVP